MKRDDPIHAIRGQTIRFTWTDGPTRGKTYEHVFAEDGTVTFRDVAAGAPKADASREKERPKYEAFKVTDDVSAVSYLSSSGYTLTAVLNFRDHSMVGFASGAKEWYPVKGTFEIVRNG
jgi:hypothetical protein